ncbi:MULTISPECIES: hypothetical protein [Burkholderiaceae]|uniref:hypothetical protein n=1 Tax=Burkholderiaceae TaxID=119060 RepID=UPI00160C6697|nr:MULTISPECIES: hypothetical protein [Burkholderiaceae]MBB2981608.1 hypothetical protein [Paraburkholderia tropica]
MSNQPRIEGTTERTTKTVKLPLVDVFPLIRAAGCRAAWVAQFLVPQEFFDSCACSVDEGAQANFDLYAERLWTTLMFGLLMGRAQPTIVLAMPELPDEAAAP